MNHALKRAKHAYITARNYPLLFSLAQFTLPVTAINPGKASIPVLKNIYISKMY